MLKYDMDHVFCSLAILVGGNSTRMGQDKGFLSVHGEPLILRLIKKLSFLFQETLIICSSLEQKEQYEKTDPCLRRDDKRGGSQVRIIVDESRGDRAAFYGLKKALEMSSYEKVVVMPVDAQGVDPGIIKKLLYSKTYPCTFRENEEKVYPFPSLWLKEQADMFPKDERSIVRLLQSFSSLSYLNATEVETKLLDVNINWPKDVGAYFGEAIEDSLKRRLNYLRLSLTESCNMMCQYCLPKGFLGSASEQMPLETAQVILKAFRRLGFEKVRFTGGEPTLHPHLSHLICDARSLGYETISLTTNGSFVKDLSYFMESGLTHINVSLDTLDSQVFQKLTGNQHLSKILSLIDEALYRGLNVKLNTVLLREINFNHVEALLSWAKDRHLTIRFIELMPIQNHTEFFNKNFVSNTEVQKLVGSLGYVPMAYPESSHSGFPGGSMEPLGPAVLWAHPEFLAKVGFISPWSCNFCDRCNRLRVTARAHLRLCLFGKEEVSLPVEQGEEAVSQFVRSVLSQKPLSHNLEKGDRGSLSHFKAVGG